MQPILTRAVARIRHRAQGDAGVTLVELMVTMTLTSILAVAALGMFLASNKATGADIDANLSTASARGALDSWTSMVQTAALPGTGSPATLANTITNPLGKGQIISSLTPTSVLFFTNLNNRSVDINKVAVTTASTLVKLEWRPSDAAGAAATICPISAAPGCLVETRYSPSNLLTIMNTRVLVTHAQAGAQSATDACGDSSTVAQTRLFTACSNGAPAAKTLSAACVLDGDGLCRSTAEDPSIISTSNVNALISGSPVSTIVIAFTVTNHDSNGDLHQQSYVSAAAITGTLTTSIGS
ncbi:prepilin-type N-terminal cleavage/methylation domain-containing protein [Frankineae bacterium MT45]|nr:prepilin-type N-terminal cleavage/methylation domain-containing protein [Frankineae bacterium MT45]